ncbi:MAG: SIMPL domain-containing protein [Dehalococcoidia bacterium]|nr:SIMPL domain-containing protein [Dehalococcoidia bacterium]
MRRTYAVPLLSLIAVLPLLALACSSDDDAGDDGGGASGPAPANAAAPQTQANGAGQGITVAGQGLVTAKPDTALLSLGVSVLSPTAREARDGAAEAMDKLLASARANGIAEEDIKTTQFSLNPEYNYSSSGSPRLTGYRLTHTLSVKTDDLDGVAKVIDDAVDAVGDPLQVSGVTFTIDDSDALLSQARGAAMTEAKAKAQELATLAGVTLGAPLAITETSSDGVTPIYFDARAGGALSLPATGTSIQTGQLDITVSVQVTYAIQ